jgi:long-chain acyl-CoA synthetase
MRTLRDAIDVQAAARPDAPFVIAPERGRTVTYSELRDTARALCDYLAVQDIPPGEVVSYMLPNGISAAGILLGATYGGYVVSPISLLAQDAQIDYTLRHSGTRIAVTAQSSARPPPTIPDCRLPVAHRTPRRPAPTHRRC